MLWPLVLAAQTGREPLIHLAIDGTKLARLEGNTRPETATARDLGPVAADLPMDHMLLELRRSAARSRRSNRSSAASRIPTRRVTTAG